MSYNPNSCVLCMAHAPLNTIRTMWLCFYVVRFGQKPYFCGLFTLPNQYMKDLFDKIRENRGPLGQHAKESHGYFTFPKLEGDIGPRMVFRGRERLNWSLNNYLG